MKTVLAAALLCSAAFVMPAFADQSACNSLSTANLSPDTKVRAATMFAADAKSGLPAFCEVSAIVTPEPGSTIGVVYRLPENWNGKLYGSGGGGFIGDIGLFGFNNVPEALRRGYATAQTDGGHPIGAPFDTTWAVNADGSANMPKVNDFSHRAIHLMTVTGKAVVEKYYGAQASHAYYQGCSTGGRMGLMEAQRYPEDYDGIIAGAPVYDLVTQTTALERGLIFANPQSRIPREEFKTLNTAALEACDAADGSKDGVLMDPRKCNFDPGVLECKADAQSAQGCLTTPQVDALRKAYDGVKTSDGRSVSYGFVRGSEAAWPQFFIPTAETSADSTNAGGMKGLAGPLLGNPDFDFSKFDPDKDFATIMSSDFGKAYNANDPNISAFANHGGKLLMWHGWNDPGPSALATIDYYEAVQKAIDAKLLKSDVRFFLAPGVEHCGGGPGADQVDWLAALENWVEKGKAPDQIIASKANAPTSWPLCAFPKLPYFKGKGDVNDPKNYSCK